MSQAGDSNLNHSIWMARRKSKRMRWGGGVFFHTIPDSPCTATPLYNSTGRLNILRMLSSLFVSKHEPSGDLQIIEKKDKG